MTRSAEELYAQVCHHARQTALLGSIEALLGWDERTQLPQAAGEYRAEQMTYLAGLVHQRRTEKQWGEWISELSSSPLVADPLGDEAVTIRQLKRDYDKKVKLPQSLVEELTRTAVLGQQSWVEARKNNDFASFRPLLEKTIELKRQEADALGYTNCRYDALLDEHEPGELTANVARVLGGLREELIPLVGAIADCERRPDLSILRRSFPVDRQQAFGKVVAGRIGFDFQRGRLDVTAHPFCSEVGPHDCRITTRYDERFFPSAFFGTLHEAGHGIYDQGLRPDQYGLPLGRFVSMGIHESQSRMWENMVGRSRAFWDCIYPEAQQAFPESLADVRLTDFYFAINDVRPSLIRVEADEVTYNLHIIIRFELEQALISGDLPVADLPTAWKEKYRQYLNIEPPNDADGVLQDIHWSAGLFGYFPTYSLGNLYAAQLFAKADAELGGLTAQFARGEFQPLREWLGEKIHRQGQRYTAAQLVEKVTGQPLSHVELINYLLCKVEPLYSNTPPVDSSPASNVASDRVPAVVVESMPAAMSMAAFEQAASVDALTNVAMSEATSPASGAAADGATNDSTPGAGLPGEGATATATASDAATDESVATSTTSDESTAQTATVPEQGSTTDEAAASSTSEVEAGGHPESEAAWSPGGLSPDAEHSFDASTLRTTPRKQQYEVGIVGNLIGVVVFGIVGLALGYWLLNLIGGPRFNFLNIWLPFVGQSTESTQLVPDVGTAGSLTIIADPAGSAARISLGDLASVLVHYSAPSNHCAGSTNHRTADSIVAAVGEVV